MQPIYIVLIAVAAVLAALFAFALICYVAAFGSRCDKNALLHYFTAEDFSLDAQPVEIKQNKNTLRGYIYTYGKPDKKGIVVFCHGMGAGHLAYTTEIARICREGYSVLAVDYCGCNLSDGKSIRGMYEGVKSVTAAIDYARRASYPKIYLVGHSWGGYCALCAADGRSVDGVVAVSAPLTPVKTLADGGAKYISRPLAVILSPFWYIINFLKFGVKGNLNSAVCAKKCGAPVLLVHGGDDCVVTPRNSAYHKAEGEKIGKYYAEGKAHNPYNTVQAERALGELLNNLARARKMTVDERKKCFGEVDWKAVTQEDEEIMQKIISHLQNN